MTTFEVNPGAALVSGEIMQDRITAFPETPIVAAYYLVAGYTQSNIPQRSLLNLYVNQVLQYIGSDTFENRPAQPGDEVVVSGITFTYFPESGWLDTTQIPGGGTGVTSVNGNVGVVNLITDDVPEGSTNEYFTDQKVDDAPAVDQLQLDVSNLNSTVGSIISADGSVTTHNDVSNAGSGQIITTPERNLLNSAIQPGGNVSDLANDAGYLTTTGINNSDDVSEGSTNLYFTDTRVANSPAVQANTAKVSADGSVTSHSDISDAGSGQIITTVERNFLATALQPGNNVSTLVNDANYLTDSSTTITDILSSISNISTLGCATNNPATDNTINYNLTVAQVLQITDPFALVNGSGLSFANSRWTTNFTAGVMVMANFSFFASGNNVNLRMRFVRDRGGIITRQSANYIYIRGGGFNADRASVIGFTVFFGDVNDDFYLEVDRAPGTTNTSATVLDGAGEFFIARITD